MADRVVVLKRVAGQLSLRRRFERLTADDVVKSERLKKILLVKKTTGGGFTPSLRSRSTP